MVDSLLVAELPRVALVAVDDDLQLPTDRPAGRQRHVGPGLLGRARALPEDDLATTGHWRTRTASGAREPGRARGRSRRRAAGTTAPAPARSPRRRPATRRRGGNTPSPCAATCHAPSSASPDPSGSRTRYGSVESGSGFRAMTNSTPPVCRDRPEPGGSGVAATGQRFGSRRPAESGRAASRSGCGRQGSRMWGSGRPDLRARARSASPVIAPTGVSRPAGTWRYWIHE